jgi:cytochrome c-type biogenesis protein CcmH
MTAHVLRHRDILRWLVCIAALAGYGLGCASRVDPAVELEERLYAPCCWRETLRVHDSDVAARLRAEIEARAAAGEPTRAIEDSIVLRYGERIRALPKGSDPRWLVGLVAAISAAAGLAWIARLVRRRGPQITSPPRAASEAAYEDRLDDELASID